jgi:uncharacterized membrane protein HdeD (DUF308 family)
VLLKWVLVLATLVLGFSVKSFNSFANFGGSILLPVVAFIFPPALYLKLESMLTADKPSRQQGPRWMVFVCVVSILLGVFMMVAGVTSGVAQLRQSNNASSHHSNHSSSSSSYH